MIKKFGYMVNKEEHWSKGEQYTIFFPNGYGASIIKFDGSYGFPLFWELAVLQGKDLKKCRLVYNNPVANGDVVGWLSDEAVERTLTRIKKLPIIVNGEKKSEKN